MASRSISAVRTWARNAGVGAEKDCGSCFRSPLSGASVTLAASTFGGGIARRLFPALARTVWFFVVTDSAPPRRISASYSNAEVDFCTSPERVTEMQHLGAAMTVESRRINNIGSRNSCETNRDHELQQRSLARKRSAALFFSGRSRKHRVPRLGHGNVALGGAPQDGIQHVACRRHRQPRSRASRTPSRREHSLALAW